MVIDGRSSAPETGRGFLVVTLLFRRKLERMRSGSIWTTCSMNLPDRVRQSGASARVDVHPDRRIDTDRFAAGHAGRHAAG
jgi:hypothetical protein